MPITIEPIGETNELQILVEMGKKDIGASHTLKENNTIGLVFYERKSNDTDVFNEVQNVPGGSIDEKLNKSHVMIKFTNHRQINGLIQLLNHIKEKLLNFDDE